MSDRGVLVQQLSARASVALGPLTGVRAQANAVMVAGSGATMVIDTMISPTMMVEPKAEAERLGGRPVRYVLNTHGDADHVLGNGLFPEAKVIAHRSVAALFGAAESRERFEAILAERAKEPEAAGIADAFVLRPPDQTFDEGIDIDLGGLTAQASYVGLAHSVADSLVWLEQEGLLVTGDLVFNGIFPLVRFDPRRWLRGLDLAASYRPERVVPGHGPVGDAGLLVWQRDVIERLHEAVATLHAAGLPLETAVGSPVPAPLASLPHAAERWPVTVRGIYGALQQGSQA